MCPGSLDNGSKKSQKMGPFYPTDVNGAIPPPPRCEHNQKWKTLPPHVKIFGGAHRAPSALRPPPLAESSMRAEGARLAVPENTRPGRARFRCGDASRNRLSELVQNMPLILAFPKLQKTAVLQATECP